MYLILRMRKNGIVMEYPMAIMVLPVTFEELSTVKTKENETLSKGNSNSPY
jgi:hypothetical protein